MPSRDLGSQAAPRAAVAAADVFVSRRFVDPSGSPCRGLALLAPLLPSSPRFRTSTGLLDPATVPVGFDPAGMLEFALTGAATAPQAPLFYAVTVSGFTFRFQARDENRLFQPVGPALRVGQHQVTVVDLAGRPVAGLLVLATPLAVPPDEVMYLVDQSLMVPLPLRAVTDGAGLCTFTLLAQSSYRDVPPEFRITSAWSIDYTIASPL